MKHIFVIDDIFFRDQQWLMDSMLDSIGQYFRTQENPDFYIQISRSRRDAIVLIQERITAAGEDDVVRVYAVGGEEILFDCLNGIAGLPNMELAVVPYGNPINFLRIFGEESTGLFSDIPAVINAPAIPTDIINAGNVFALNACMIGLLPVLGVQMREVNKKKGSDSGVYSFFLKILAYLNRIPMLLGKRITARQYSIKIDDEDYSGRYSLIKVANGPYYSRNKFTAAGAMPDDGLLEVALFKAADPFSTLWSIRAHSRGRVPSKCISLKAKKIEIVSEDPMWIQLDNEYLQNTHVTFEIIPEAVQFVAVNNLTYREP